MKPFINILAWIAVGIVLGLAIFLVVSPPSQLPPANQTNITNATQPPSLPPVNTTPPANATPPGPRTSIDVFLIPAPNCERCNAIDYQLLNQTVSEISKSPSAVVGTAGALDPASAEAQALISKYNITLLPALVISDKSGFTSQDMDTWSKQLGSVEPDGFMVQRLVYPPYYDLANRSYGGFVKAVAISASGCDKCMNASQFADSLEQSSAVKMAFSNKTVLDENSSEAQALISRYNITKLPTLLLSLDVSAYPVYQQLKPLGEERDGLFILRLVHPPYLDLADNRSVRGLVSLIQIKNSSCADCFNPDTLSDYITNNAGVELVNKTTYEANSTEAKALIARYNLTFVPTVLFSPELDAYPHFRQIWTSQNNTVEPDGWYVFRAYQVVPESYQNLTR